MARAPAGQVNKATKPGWGDLDAQGTTARSTRRAARADRRCEAAFRSILSSRAAFWRGTCTDGTRTNDTTTTRREGEDNQDQDNQNEASQDQVSQHGHPPA